MSEVRNDVAAAYRKYLTALGGIRGHGATAYDAGVAELRKDLNTKLETVYGLMLELNERDIGHAKEQVALAIVRAVNAKIRDELAKIATNTSVRSELSFIITDPRHARNNFVVIEQLWPLLKNRSDIAEVSELISELTSRYVISGEIPPLLVSSYQHYGDIKVSFQFPY